MSKPDRKHGIEGELHLNAERFAVDAGEELAAARLAHEAERTTDADRVEHTVWDEVALLPHGVGTPAQPDITYRSWLEEQVARSRPLTSWLLTLMIAVSAGPWGVVAALATASASGFALLAITVFGPVAEEIAKVATAMWVVEKRPFWFRSPLQILFCAACGGLAFAAIENLIYMYVYVPNHNWAFVRFRWTVCVALHVGCSSLAGVGLVRVWQDAMKNLRRPTLAPGVPWFVVAMVIHGVYNFVATLASATGWLDFHLESPGE